MYRRWLDRWDERRAQRGDAVKVPTEFQLGYEIAFPGMGGTPDIAEFCGRALEAAGEHSFYDLPSGSIPFFERDGDTLRFDSLLTTGVTANDVVTAKVTEGGKDQVLVVFHHWNASSRQKQLASFLSKRGVTVVEITMPYHFERSRPGATYADHILSSNLGRTLQSMRQAVWDGRTLIEWLKQQGYGEISVLGMSLGSWVAGLVAAHDTSVARASLFLTAGSLADMVWTGRATEAIRASLDGSIDLDDLRKAWAPLDQENYVEALSREDLSLQIILAERDTVVRPEVSQPFVRKLQGAGAKLDVLRLNCGHYSLALPPHIIFAGLRLKRLLSAAA